jgi:broad specificity phosphatase PhoE
MSIICLVRHGDRLDTNNYEEWQNSPCYKENSHDMPLSELGFAEILKHKGHIPEVDYKSFYLPQQIPFSEDDCAYGNRMIKVMNSLALNGQNVAFIGHKGTVTLAAVYLRKELHNLPNGEFFRPINSVYFGDENGMKNGGLTSVYGLMLQISKEKCEVIG